MTTCRFAFDQSVQKQFGLHVIIKSRRAEGDTRDLKRAATRLGVILNKKVVVERRREEESATRNKRTSASRQGHVAERITGKMSKRDSEF